MIRRFALATLLCAFAFPALAERQAQIGDVSEFLDYQRTVRSKIEDGKYGKFSRSEINRLDRAQNTMFKLLTGKESTDELSEKERMEVFNAQQEVQALLAENDQDKVTCRREKSVGSHFRRSNCKTQAQREREAEAARTSMQDRVRGTGGGVNGN